MITVGELQVSHDGPSPYQARSAGKSDDGPIWYVAGADGLNRVRVENRRGVTLFSRHIAELIAAALNEAPEK